MKKSLFLIFACLSIIHISYSQTDQTERIISVMEFENTSYDFGTITSGEKANHVFTFTNTGDVPLVLTNVKGSCGCTVPYFPKDPILPGESSEIEVSFDSKNKFGRQSKRVTITANTDPVNTFLTIRGDVIKRDEAKTEELEVELAQQKQIKEELQTLDKSCFAIFPNPSSEYVQIELKEYIGQSAEIEIRNETGQRITNKTIQRISRETTQIDVSNYTPGMYLIIISVGKEKPMSQCFVVART